MKALAEQIKAATRAINVLKSVSRTMPRAADPVYLDVLHVPGR